MRIFTKTAAAASAVGLLAFGAVAGIGGSALASTQQSVTGCSAVFGSLALGLQPNCTAAVSTVDNPTSMTITLSATSLGSLISSALGQGVRATWTLSCVVNGAPVTVPGSYTITNGAQSLSTTVNLQSTVGSPEPNTCTLTNLKAQTLLGLSVGALGLSPFTIGVGATSPVAVPGAIYQSEGTTKAGANAVLCADDAGNANAGSKIQAYQCLSDLADYYVRTSAGNLVHNGDCVGLSGNRVILAACSPSNAFEKWSQSGVGGELRNLGSNSCLTATSVKDFTQLTVQSCDNGADQKWHVPNVTA